MPDVGRVHPVVDSLAFGVLVACCDACLQIDDPGVATSGIEQRQRVAPWPRPIRRMRNRPVRPRRQIDVRSRVTHYPFVQHWISRMRKDLIDPATEHHIAAQEECQGAVAR